MRKFNPATVASLLSLTGCASSLLAQAPATAQVWDVRFVVDSAGPYAEGSSATQVGITIFARVGILPNTANSGTNNLGVGKVGGNGSATTGFRMVFSDPAAAGLGVDQGNVQRGFTRDIDGRDLLDTNGVPLAGTFAPFRGAFTPQVAPSFLGSNTVSTNGSFNNPATGSPSASNMNQTRALNFGSEGTGPVGVATATDSNPVNLAGELVSVYRLYYFASSREGIQFARTINVDVSSLAVRYVFALNGNNASTTPDNNLGSRSFSFQVPAPGAAALVGLSLVFAVRRRR